MKKNSVCVIIVTYNRLELLKKCIQALENQTLLPQTIFVVNNSSTDDTLSWLSSKENILFITLPNNGATASFKYGINWGIKHLYEWIWIMDDDSIPDSDALKKLIEFADKVDSSKIGYLTPAVVWKDSSLHKMNAQHQFKPGPNFYNDLNNYAIKSEYASFVGLLISRNAILKVGLPFEEYFIWADDLEFTERINREFDSWLVFNSKVLHFTASNHSPKYNEINNENLFKFKYGFRNKVHLIRKRYDSKLKGYIFSTLWLSWNFFKILSKSPKYSIKIFFFGLKGLCFNPKIQHVK